MLGLKIDVRLGISFIHVMGIMFAIEMLILIALRNRYARAEPYVVQTSSRIMDLTPWRHAGSFSIVLLAALVSIYLTFSPLGVASAAGPSSWFVPLLATVWVAALAAISVVRRRWRQREPDAKSSLPTCEVQS